MKFQILIFLFLLTSSVIGQNVSDNLDKLLAQKNQFNKSNKYVTDKYELDLSNDTLIVLHTSEQFGTIERKQKSIPLNKISSSKISAENEKDGRLTIRGIGKKSFGFRNLDTDETAGSNYEAIYTSTEGELEYLKKIHEALSLRLADNKGCPPLDSIQIGTEEYLVGYKNSTLVNKAQLNKSDNVSEELGKIILNEFPDAKDNPALRLAEFLIVIEKDGTISKVINIGNLAAEQYKDDLAALPDDKRKEMEMSLGILSADDNDKIISAISKQKWKPGMCQDKSVITLVNVSLK